MILVSRGKQREAMRAVARRFLSSSVLNEKILACISFDSISQIILKESNKFDGLNCANALKIYGKTKRVENSRVSQEKLLEACSKVEFSPETLSRCCYSIANYKIFPTFPNIFLEQIHQANMESFLIPDLVLLVASFAKINFTQDLKILEKLSNEIINRNIKSLGLQDISNTCWVLLQLETNPKVFENLASQVTNQDLSSINLDLLLDLYEIFTQAQVNNQDVYEKISQEISKRNFSQIKMQLKICRVLHGNSELLVKIADQLNLREIKSVPTSNLVDFLFHLSLQIQHGFFEKLSQEFFNRNKFSIEDLAKLTLGFSRLNLYKSMVKKLTGEILKRDFDLLNSKEYSLLSELGNHQVLEKIVMEISSRNLNELDPKDLVELIKNFSKANFKNERFLKILSNEILKTSLTLRDLSSLIYSLANLNHYNEQLVDSIAIKVEKSHKDILPRDLTMFLWSFACFDILKNPHVSKLIEQVDKSIFKPSERLSQIRLACWQTFQKDYFEFGLLETSTSMLSLYSKNDLEKDAIVKWMAVDYWIPSKMLAFELDLGRNWFQDGFSKTGTCLFRERLFKNEGIELVSIPRKIKREEERIEFVKRNLLERIQGKELKKKEKAQEFKLKSEILDLLREEFKDEIPIDSDFWFQLHNSPVDLNLGYSDLLVRNVREHWRNVNE